MRTDRWTRRSAGDSGNGYGRNGYHVNGLHKTSVMVVDDEPIFVRIASLFLETHHKNEVEIVGTANGGEECLAQVQLLAPDVVLLDLNMPGLSGLQTIPLLRIMYPELRIVALTLNDDEMYRKAVLAAGGNELVSKATMNTDLIPAIHRVMEEGEVELERVAA
ncbi:MAG: response regulator transcription factor [Chloroflexi bacterium]|nr:response regulator transcription factor [Chloroflexota bacterium]